MDSPLHTVHSTDKMRLFLNGVKAATGAVSSSIVLVQRNRKEYPPSIYHDGSCAPLAELACEDSVRELLRCAEEMAWGNSSEVSETGVYHLKSALEDGHLLCVSLSQFVKNLDRSAEGKSISERRRRDASNIDGYSEYWACIGLRYGSRKIPKIIRILEGELTCQSDTDWNDLEGYLKYLFAVACQSASDVQQLASFLQDPTSQLRGRVEFQVYLKSSFSDACKDDRSLGLALINPDEFGLVNQRLGHERGDATLREVATKLQSCLRKEDVVFHYGSAVFAVILWTDSHRLAEQTAERMRSTLTHHNYLEGGVRLTFSVGLAVLEAVTASRDGFDSGELLRRADKALNSAKLAGGGRTVHWASDDVTTTVGNHDRLNGIFTAETEKDYRNMFMLWDAVTFISTHTEAKAIAAEFVQRVSTSFKTKRVGIFGHRDGGQPELLAGIQNGSVVHLEKGGARLFLLSEQQRKLLTLVQQSEKMERLLFSVDEKKTSEASRPTAYAMPMVAREAYFGCLYLEDNEDRAAVDSSDLVFLTALAKQVAVALDRAELILRWKEEKEIESRQLREEVRELRMALQPPNLLQRSVRMGSVLEMVHRAAPTDATVLITGESGTGKELLARTIHEQSQRQEQPFVTVDCGAIAKSLLEAELFGYTKGAYTGAEASSLGRIAMAEGGTLFLDEVGELPIEVQAKLLRFVQEKEILPVGSSNVRRVDVRIVAATNRFLPNEVAEGRFRQDLYFRLQVVTIVAPPLRERPEDILLLAGHFVEKFAVQYHKGSKHLSPKSEEVLLNYGWPGNVRELQNRILQAVVLSNSEEIQSEELRLNEGDICSRTEVHGMGDAFGSEGNGTALLDNRVRKCEKSMLVEVSDEGPTGNPWEKLRKDLVGQIEFVLYDKSGSPFPLGRWLTEDLVLVADAETEGRVRQAASMLGMSETTFRRQVYKVKESLRAGLLPRAKTWQSVRNVLVELVREEKKDSEMCVVDRARRLLLAEVVSRLSDNEKLGSALMGVTLPTYRRWMSDCNVSVRSNGEPGLVGK